jgi:hypothetical protein
MLFNGAGVAKMLQFWQAAQAESEYNYHDICQSSMPEIGTLALRFFNLMLTS